MACETTQKWFYIVNDPRCNNSGEGTIRYILTPLVDQGPYTYTWYKNNIPILNGPIATFVFLDLPLTINDTYQFIITGASCVDPSNPGSLSGPCTQCEMQLMSNITLPSCANNNEGCARYVFGNSPGGVSPYFYSWYKYDGSGLTKIHDQIPIIPGQQTPCMELNPGGVYRFFVEDSNGCVDYANPGQVYPEDCCTVTTSSNNILTECVNNQFNYVISRLFDTTCCPDLFIYYSVTESWNSNVTNLSAGVSGNSLNLSANGTLPFQINTHTITLTINQIVNNDGCILPSNLFEGAQFTFDKSLTSIDLLTCDPPECYDDMGNPLPDGSSCNDGGGLCCSQICENIATVSLNHSGAAQVNDVILIDSIVTPSASYTYSWSLSSGLALSGGSLTDPDINVTANTEGTHTATLQVFTPQGCLVDTVVATVQFTTTPVGTCCQPDGACAVVEQSQCTGVWDINGTICSPNPCPQPMGACCTGSNCSIATQDDCVDNLGGAFQGAGITCSPDPCATCQVTLADDVSIGTPVCATGGSGGTTPGIDVPIVFDIRQGLCTCACDIDIEFKINGSTVIFPSNVCTQGTVTSNHFVAVCNLIPGQQISWDYAWNTTTNSGNICTINGPTSGSGVLTYTVTQADIDACCSTTTTGACCVGSSCSIVTELGCLAAGGSYQGDNADCSPNPCSNPIFYSECSNGTCSPTSFCSGSNSNCFTSTTSQSDADTQCIDNCPDPECTCSPITLSLNRSDNCENIIASGTGSSPNCPPGVTIFSSSWILLIDGISWGSSSSSSNSVTITSSNQSAGSYQLRRTINFSDGGSCVELSNIETISSCEQETGACCDGANCSITSEDNCVNTIGGTYQGNGETCSPNPCESLTTYYSVCQGINGSCGIPLSPCSGDSCYTSTISQSDATSLCNSSCSATIMGACCDGANCTQENLPDCVDLNGTWMQNIDCSPNPCGFDCSTCSEPECCNNACNDVSGTAGASVSVTRLPSREFVFPDETLVTPQIEVSIDCTCCSNVTGSGSITFTDQNNVCGPITMSYVTGASGSNVGGCGTTTTLTGSPPPSCSGTGATSYIAGTPSDNITCDLLA